METKSNNEVILPPINNFVNPLLTDLYQITMAYSYWKSNRHNMFAVFDLFFRRCPFHGEFAIFSGLEECIRHVANFKFTKENIDQMKKKFNTWDPKFFEYLSTLDCKDISIFAIKEGTIVFPRVPLIRVEGPLLICQLLETTFLTLINYATLISTNAARYRLAAGDQKVLFEFGLRRAQGPDGGISATRYSYIGGFDGTSNVEAGLLFDIPIKGTHAHSFVSSFFDLDCITDTSLKNSSGEVKEFVSVVQKWREKLNYGLTNNGELSAFIVYAQTFPTNFLALVDTYDTIQSGVPNFMCVALALIEFGYRPSGIRLDSGDLSYYSNTARKMFVDVSSTTGYDLSSCIIVASNDINEEVLKDLFTQGHSIDVFGVGTNLVTCSNQPALGGVFKLVEIEKKPRIKLSNDTEKMTIPGRKDCYRLYDKNDNCILDLLVLAGTPPLQINQRILCRHPFNDIKRVYVTPSKVEQMHFCFWKNGILQMPLPSLKEIRQRVINQLKAMRDDHIRYLNPSPYKVSCSNELFAFTKDLWCSEAPITEIS